MADLITSGFAQQLPPLAALAGSNAPLLATLISAASQQIIGYCRRNFTLQTYTEYLSGSGIPYDECILPEFPVSAILRVATSPVGALMVSNTDTTDNQRATVETTATGINLRRWASGTEFDTPPLTYVLYPTLMSMASAISDVGFGWSATAMGGYEKFASADLRIPQGQVTTISGGATLELFTEELPTWGAFIPVFDGSGYFNGSFGWRIASGSGRLKGFFPQGALNIRVDYTAGFATIPLDLQQAVALQAQFLYQSGNVDFNLSSERIGPYAKTLATKTDMPPAVKAIINKYRDLSKNMWTEKQ